MEAIQVFIDGRTDEDDPVYIHNGIFSAIKSEIFPLTTWMDLEGIILRERSQREKDKYHMISQMWNLKNKMRKNKKTETDSKYREPTGSCQRKWVGGRMSNTVKETKRVQNSRYKIISCQDEKYSLENTVKTVR